MVVEINLSGTGRIFVDDVLVGSSTTATYSGGYAGGNNGGFITANGSNYIAIRGSEPNVGWAYGFSGGLRQYQNQLIADRRFDIETTKTEDGVAGTGAVGTSTPATNIAWNEGAWNTGTWGN